MKKDEKGFAAILVTMIIVVTLSLITIGFIAVVSREQRQTQDRQLSTQAFYAAETGVNDAVERINAGLPPDYSKTTCPPDGPPGFAVGSNIISDGVEYSCLLIESRPRELEYGSVGFSTPVVAPIQPIDDLGNPVLINKLEISWEGISENGGSGFATTMPTFPQSTAWTSQTGVLRVGLTPSGGPVTRDGLRINTFTSFFYPQNGPAAAVDSAFFPNTTNFNQGSIVSGNCNQSKKPTSFPRYCAVNITGISGNDFILSLRSVYANSKVTIKAFSGPTQRRLTNAQVMVDSTGKASDVLRRIAVRVPKESNVFPGFVLETVEDICKQYGITPNPPGVNFAGLCIP